MELGIHGSLLDHQPVKLSVKGLTMKRGKKDPWHLKRTKRIQIDMQDYTKVEELQRALKQVPSYGWDLDVHRHVEYLHRSIARKARMLADKPVHVWKEHLQEDTWEAVGEKTCAKKEYFKWKSTRKLAYLRLCWQAWVGSKRDVGWNEEIHKVNINLAKNENFFRKASIKAQELVRRDDNIFLKSFTERAEQVANQGDMKSLWKELKRFLPKHRNKKQANVKQNEALKEQWAPHLCQMEAGTQMAADEIYKNCINRQNKNPSIHSTLKEIPSLLDIEWTLREAKPGKQGGMDGLEPTWVKTTAREMAPLLWRISLKQSLWGVEAIQFKGGTLAMLRKPGGNHMEAGGYRGILLSAEMGKRLQALTRKELISCMYPSRPPLQLGGFQNMEPAFGAHYVRSYMHICATMKCSCTVIFVDLKAAYHSLIRQLLTGRCQGDEEDMKIIYECLEREGIETKSLEEAWNKDSILEELEASESLQARMKEYNMDTWSNIFGAGCLVKTNRGSRPGSPLADSQFSVLMAKIGHILQDKLREIPEVQKACSYVNLPPATVIWADDLAITFPVQENERILDITTSMMSTTQRCFTKKGLSVNYKKGKSEAIVTLCGPGAREERRKILVQPALHLQESRNQTLRLEGRYRHLGTVQECGGGLRQEIVYRTASTWASYREIRHILSRQSIDLGIRLRLAQALLWSRLFYGAGAWGQLPKREMRKLNTCYMGILRRVTGKMQTGKATHSGWTDRKILAEFELPCVRTILAIVRLCYARRVWMNGGPLMKEILQQEAETCQTSWKAGLQEDLQWLGEVRGGDWGRDLHTTSTFWEERRKGWKAFVKGAQKRHVLQEALAFALNQKGSIGERDNEVIQEEDGWLCGCGAWFESRKSLRVHQHKKHGLHNEIYQMISGTTCPICLMQLWTPQRLQAHLSYQPRGGGGNLCYSLLSALCFKREEVETTEPDIPLKGIQRRDAVRCAGPLRFGVDPDDEGYAIERILHLEKKIGGSEIEDLTELLETGTNDNILFVLTEELDWEEKMDELKSFYDGSLNFTVNLLFCGGRFQWKKREDQRRWREYVERQPSGLDLCEWFDLRLRLAFVTRAKELRQEKFEQDTHKQIIGEKGDGQHWRRAINEVRTTCTDGLRGVELDCLRKPGASIKLLVTTLRKCR